MAPDTDVRVTQVSRGGRPELAKPALPNVTAPTLLIEVGFDNPVIAMNRDAMRQMRHEVKLEIVPGATHLFDEAGTLETVADLAARWFVDHFQPAGSNRQPFNKTGH